MVCAQFLYKMYAKRIIHLIILMGFYPNVSIITNDNTNATRQVVEMSFTSFDQ